MRKPKPDNLNWPQIWKRIKDAEAAGVDSVDMSPEENAAVQKVYDDFAYFSGHMRPPEGIPPERQRAVDKQFQEYVRGQFKYLEAKP